ncbi:hypothetical protein [Methylophilus sp. QUAN]|uniref:hypothetical protein n=1 Tax=Methylophilus sp. QUAN TaxID=2781020 RepID=UPI00188F687F|nr:hypothetical protein [Methylophilus sp. QUAN]MBF4991124.1 hypothetical protein [Methylophilus sp. QUAN]
MASKEDDLLEKYTSTFNEVARYSIQMQYKWVKYGAFIDNLPYEDAKIEAKRLEYEFRDYNDWQGPLWGNMLFTVQLENANEARKHLTTEMDKFRKEKAYSTL